MTLEQISDSSQGDKKSKEFEDQLDRMKDEIVALQISTRKSISPWYQSVGGVLSIVSILVSFGTTIVTYQRTHQEATENSRRELRGFIQRLTQLQKESFDLMRSKNDPATMATLSGLLNSENMLVANQASEVIRRIPQVISSTEYLSVGNALASSALFDQAFEFTRAAIDKAENASDEVNARRTFASYFFQRNLLDSGRMQYQEALNVFTRFPTKDSAFWYQTQTQTEMAWADYELRSGHLQDASFHIKKADQYQLKSGMPTLRAQIENLKAAIFKKPEGFTNSKISQVLPYGKFSTELTLKDLGYSESSSDFAGLWVIILQNDNTFHVTRNGKIMVEGKFTITAGTISFTDESGTARCFELFREDLGIYAWTLDQTSLRFTMINDDCNERNLILTSRTFKKAK